MLVLAACARPPAEMSDWERQNAEREAPREENVVPPAFPRGPAGLIEYSISDARGYRFFVDAGTLTVSKEGIVRYAVIAQSPEGAQNVSFEGLRCSSAEHRLYALGRSDRTWAASRTTWQPVRSARPWQITLYREYFCPQKAPIRDAAEGVRALQAGGHPSFKGISPQYGL